jgi:hypothetical protein
MRTEISALRPTRASEWGHAVATARGEFSRFNSRKDLNGPWRRMLQDQLARPSESLGERAD